MADESLPARLLYTKLYFIGQFGIEPTEVWLGLNEQNEFERIVEKGANYRNPSATVTEYHGLIVRKSSQPSLLRVGISVDET